MIHADLRLSHIEGIDSMNYVHIITDEQFHPNIQNNEYTRILKKVGNISLTNHAKGAICTVYGPIVDRDFEEVGYRLKDLGYKYAFFWFEGTFPTYEFEQVFESWVKENNDWHLIGYVSNNEHTLPTFEPQLVIVNLQKFDEINFRNPKNNEYPKYKYDGSYNKPAWIKGTGGWMEFDNPQLHTKHLLDNLLYDCIKQEMKIIQMPNILHDDVFCLYPERDVEDTLYWLTNSEFHAKSYEEKSQYKFDNVPGEKWALYEFLNMSNEILYVTNTEDYPKESEVVTAKDTNVIICPASGLNQFLFAMPHMDTLEKIVWTDFNPMSIRWLKHIINNWDGHDFRQFFENSKPLLLEWGLKDLEFLNYRDQQIDELTEMFNTDEINAKYNRLREIEHVFLNIDIVNQYDQILPHVKNSNVILQLSNIYSYEINYIVNKYFKAQQAFYSLVNGLLQDNKNVYLRGDTPQGVYYEMTNIGKLGSL